MATKFQLNLNMRLHARNLPYYKSIIYVPLLLGWFQGERSIAHNLQFCVLLATLLYIISSNKNVEAFGQHTPCLINSRNVDIGHWYPWSVTGHRQDGRERWICREELAISGFLIICHRSLENRTTLKSMSRNSCLQTLSWRKCPSIKFWPKHNFHGKQDC